MTVIGVDMGEELAEVKKYAAEMKISYPVLIDTTGDYTTMFQVRVRPTTFFINKEGVITSIIQGLVTPETLKRELAVALK
jgi:cytochrome c biogenesis protein CcmG, thiol:disulfide interchange protein DsbE